MPQHDLSIERTHSADWPSKVTSLGMSERSKYCDKRSALISFDPRATYADVFSKLRWLTSAGFVQVLMLQTHVLFVYLGPIRVDQVVNRYNRSQYWDYTLTTDTHTLTTDTSTPHPNIIYLNNLHLSSLHLDNSPQKTDISTIVNICVDLRDSIITDSGLAEQTQRYFIELNGTEKAKSFSKSVFESLGLELFTLMGLVLVCDVFRYYCDLSNHDLTNVIKWVFRSRLAE